MKKPCLSLLYPAFLIVCACAVPVPALLLSATRSIKLSSPVSTELAGRIKDETRREFRKVVLEYVSGNADLSLDTANTIDNYYFTQLFDYCMQNAKESSGMDGFTWRYTVSLLPEVIFQSMKKLQERFREQMRGVVVSRPLPPSPRPDTLPRAEEPPPPDSTVQRLALRSLTDAAANVFACRAHIFLTERDSTSRTCDRSREVLSELLDRISVSCSEAIVAGKPGHTPENDPVVTVAVDSIPLPEIPVIGQLQDGRIIFSANTDSAGKLSLKTLRIPYVAYGTFFTLRLNLGALIDPSYFFPAGDFRGRRTPTTMLIFKTEKPLFSLSYTVERQEGMEVPSSFSDNSFIESYLRRSLYLRPGATEEVDLAFTISCRTSRTVNKEKGVVTLSVSVTADVTENSTKRTVSRDQLLYEQLYDIDYDIQVGLFFHETGRALRELIGEMVQEL